MVDANASFTEPQLNADPCNFVLVPPSFSFSFTLPSLPNFPPTLPLPSFHFELSCSPDNPISVSADVEWGGGQTPNYNKSPDLEEVI